MLYCKLMLVDAIACLFHIICLTKESISLKKMNEKSKIDRLVGKLIISQSVWELEPEPETKI